MDLNLIVLCGRLATDPELRVFDSGTRLVLYLVTVKADHPQRRVDVVPVTQWDPSDETVQNLPTRGTRVWVCGSVQRRFWESPDGRRSRVEVVAEQVHARELVEDEEVEVPV